VTEGAREKDRGVGGVNHRAASWLAWSLCGLTLALIACAYAFVVLITIRGHPTDVYSYLSPLGVIPYALVGGVIASRRRKNPVGWFLVGSAVIVALQEFMFQYTTYNPVTDSGVLPLRQEMVWLLSWTYIPGIMLLLAFLPLYFPNGRLLSSRWRWVVRIAVLVTVVYAINSAFLPGEINNVLFVTLFAVVFASAICLVLRFRSSSGQERQQIKWLAFAASLVPVWLVFNYPFESFSPPLFAVVENLMLMSIPVAVGIAIFRYRLYDIDRIINRTLVYASLTAILVGVYFGGVTATQAFFRTLTDQEKLPQLVVVASTLVIAALFNPLRRRIQSFIDRSFYRRKYDAAKTLEGFSMKLRDETDLNALSDDLVGVVRETMQPAYVSLWLHPDPALKDKKERAAIRESGRDEE
jgi:hypothetical protein